MDVFRDAEWEQDIGPARGARLGPQLGARDLGVTLFELDPGGQAAPYHLHHGNEELLVMLDGELELRTPDGLRAIGRGEMVAFVTGPDGAHRVRNAGSEPARYLVVSTKRFPEVAEYPDTGMVLPMKGSGDGWVFAGDQTGDYMQTVLAALQAERTPSPPAG
ncbi:MAG TPA: cupin domain-containing protein [Solirubrobacteraceae bacterium]|nr:cupin domain-containing protein [Solirubrobacteraceae bacterium]